MSVASSLTLAPWRGPRGDPLTCTLGDHVCEVYGAATLAGGELSLQSEVTWVLSGPAHLLEEVHGTLPGQSTRLREDLLVLDFGNSVGVIDLPALGRWRLSSGKWDQAHFDWMLKDLMEVASALPFAASNASALPYDRSVAAREDVLYHAFVYLRDKLLHSHGGPDDLLSSFNVIVREPHHRLEQRREGVTSDRASWIEPPALIDLVAGGAPLLKVRGAVAALPLAQRLCGHLPEHMQETRVWATHDTAENRFVKTFLSLVSGVIDRMCDRAEQEPTNSRFRANVLRDCEAMRRVCFPIQRHPLWREVGDMIHLPAASTVLQQRRAYKEVFGHFARLRLAARVPLDSRVVRDLLEIRDVAQLYELWCFFAVARAVTAVLGLPPDQAGRPQPTDTELKVPWDLDVEWRGIARLYYNRSFSHSSASQYSYSVPLRPDIVLELQTPTGVDIHILDAKFKLESVAAFEEDAAATENAERRGTFTRGDLYKMHAYRDAIRDARSVWILYPGTEARFFCDAGPRWPNPSNTLPRLDGVGALPLRPGKPPHPRLTEALQKMLLDRSAVAA